VYRQLHNGFSTNAYKQIIRHDILVFRNLLGITANSLFSHGNKPSK